MSTDYEELAITFATLLGAEMHHDDYGHPERASARQYHRCSNGPFTAYGYTAGGAALHFLKVAGYRITSEGNLEKNPRAGQWNEPHRESYT